MREFRKVIFPDQLILKYPLGSGRTLGVKDWILEADFRVFWTDERGIERHYTAKAGLITDGPSIPGWAQSVINKEGIKAPASVIHDDQYMRRVWPRKECDRLLYAGLRASGVGWLEAKAMYWAVRVGGGKQWDDDD